MGNSQSSEASRRRSHRLSKPKTNNHATAGLLSPNGLSNTFSNNKTPKRVDSARMSAALPPPPSPATSSVVYSSAPDAMWEVEQSFERSMSLVATTEENESKRRSLFRSKSSQVSSKSERRNSSLGPASRLIDKIGRTNSLTYESALSHYGTPNPDIWSGAPKARSSWNYDLSSYEAKRLLNLVEEPATEHGPALSDHNVTVVSESTWKSSNPAQPASTPITRANSDVSLYMPVRRRSIIQKPGIATRSNSVREGFSQSRPTFRYSHPPTPSLSRQQSIESYRSGVMSMPPQRLDIDSIPRVSTPCEEKYQSIGGFKLGSLRITNGAASPASPEDEKPDQIAGRQDDTGAKDTRHLRVPSEQGILASNALQIIMQKSEDPFKTDSVQLSVPEPRPIAEASDSVQPLSVTTGGNPAMAAPSEPQYLGQISFSPFSLDEHIEVTSPKLQTTSKATAQEDELFDEETQVEYSSVEVLDVRLDPNAKSEHGPATGAEKMATVERKDSGFVSISSPLSSAAHKPLTKADSGYSSNVSLRSFQSKSQIVERESTASPEGQVSRTAQSGLAPVADLKTPSKIVAPRREAPRPPVPPKDYPKSPTQAKPIDIPGKSQSTPTRANGSFLSASGTFRSSKISPVPLRNLTNSLSGPNSPEGLPLTPASAKSAKSDKSGSTLSIGSGSNKSNRFQKLLNSARRPSSGPLTVHTTHVVEKNGIPSIPQDVEHKLHEHTGMFPITTKRLALKPRTSMDTLKTIFSVGSMEASLDAVNRLSGVEVYGGEVYSEVDEAPVSKDSQWRHTLQSVPSQIAHVAAHVIPRKPIARKSLDQGPSQEANSQVSRETTHIAYSYTNTTEIHSSSQRGISSPENPDRKMSMRLSMERSLDVEVVTSGTSIPNLSTSLPSPALPSPLLARPLENKPRTGPPVSMSNRRPGALRVPPPLRSQPSTSSLSRRASAESLHSRSSAHSSAGMTSRENLRSAFSPYQQGPVTGYSEIPPAIPTMDPRRLNAFRQSQPPSASWARVPSWDIQTDHETSRQGALASLEGTSRHNSLSSNPGQTGFTIQRSASAQGWKVQSNNPPLRHRSSYDEYSRHNSLQYSHPPSMSNGYTAPPPKAMQSSEHYDFVNNQWVVADGRYPPPQPPHVPRTPKHHQRKRSMSAYGHQAPYRILHSYNSPAYRNVPIWG